MRSKIITINEYPLEVFENGDVFRLARKVQRSNGKCNFYPKKKVNPFDNGNGYMTTTIMVNGKSTYLYIHRLVAIAFIPNPNNLPEVNHIDGIKNNNDYTNLEWIDRKGNVRDYIKKGRARYPKRKPILQFDSNGILVDRYEKVGIAAVKYNITEENIRTVAKNRGKTAAGYHWIFEENYNSDVHTNLYISNMFKRKSSNK